MSLISGTRFGPYEIASQGLTTANYDVTPDGRFIMLRREAQGGNLRIVLNWTEELKQILTKSGGC